MSPTDEELLHSFYGGDNAALGRLAERRAPMLSRIAYSLLKARIGSAVQARAEWDLGERMGNVWAYVLSTRNVNIGRWPNQRLSALTWLVHLVCLEMDRHLGFSGPF
jgi:hypothetical protein